MACPSPHWGLPSTRRGPEGEEAEAALEVTVRALRVPARLASCSGVTASVSFSVCGSDSVLWDIY